MSRHPNIKNVKDLEWLHSEQGERFAVDRKQLGGGAGAQHLGVSLLRLQPGKTAWPHHYHHANEEGIYILEGDGRIRIGEEQHEVGAGDYIAFPVGPDHAHQLTNIGSDPLLYLCMSTMIPTDVMGYPDSGKIAFTAGSAPGGDKRKRLAFQAHRVENAVDYWDGES